MMAFLRKYEVWCFMGLIIVVNTLFVSGIVFKILPNGLYSYGRFALLGGTLAGVVLLARGWPGIVDLLRPMTEWRRPAWMYLLALVCNPLVCLLVLSGISLATVGRLPDIQLKYSVLTRPDVAMIILFSSLVGEIAWISYAVRRLSTRFTPYVSAVIVGAVWTAWWAPMAIYGYGIVPGLPLAGLLFNQIGVAAVCTFVYMHTRSGLLVLCAQLAFNSSILIFPVMPTDGGLQTYWIFAITYFLVSMLLFVIFGPKPVFSRRQPEEDAAVRA
ncbi:MAG: hypothetical protein HC844_18115 [Tabrizicola sp.]|nr:hypothetical protein [Tabrizicola sp.]